jgi:hypothetical protein
MLIKPDEIIKYYKVQHTGWHGGSGWFDIYSNRRLNTFEKAKELFHSRVNDENTSWRIVEITVFKYYQDKSQPSLETQKITQERYLYVNKDYT